MARGAKRVRGWLIRLALNRSASIVLGLALAAPAVWLYAVDREWEGPATDGLGLVLGATGAALLLVGVGGRRPDWIDADE
jgi:hypothetical protein